MSKTTLILLAVLAFLIMGTGGMIAYNNSKRRGIRNNNPGNLRITDIPWQGKVPRSNNTDGAFEQFTEARWGIRALYRDIYGDIYRKGQNTVRKLITSYAPASENNTAAYVSAVAAAIGKHADAPIVGADIVPILKAIIRHENAGEMPYPDALFNEAVALA